MPIHVWDIKWNKYNKLNITLSLCFIIYTDNLYMPIYPWTNPETEPAPEQVIFREQATMVTYPESTRKLRLSARLSSNVPRYVT